MSVSLKIARIPFQNVADPVSPGYVSLYFLVAPSAVLIHVVLAVINATEALDYG